MSSATEMCGCGAKITIDDANGDAVLRKALSEWRSTHRHAEPVRPTAEENSPEYLPQGNNFSSTERIGESTRDRDHELNGRDRPSFYGRPISLKWQSTP